MGFIARARTPEWPRRARAPLRANARTHKQIYLLGELAFGRQLANRVRLQAGHDGQKRRPQYHHHHHHHEQQQQVHQSRQVAFALAQIKQSYCFDCEPISSPLIMLFVSVSLAAGSRALARSRQSSSSSPQAPMATYAQLLLPAQYSILLCKPSWERKITAYLAGRCRSRSSDSFIKLASVCVCAARPTVAPCGRQK